MKRHEALAPLSRDHHGGLLLAQLMKKNAPVYRGLPETLEGKVKYAVVYYHDHLQDHFAKEEAMLKLAGLPLAAFTRLVDEIVGEHRMLTQMFNDLNSTSVIVDAMDEAGRLLEQHIRKEERVLFPMLQEHCSEEQFESIAMLFQAE